MKTITDHVLYFQRMNGADVEIHSHSTALDDVIGCFTLRPIYTEGKIAWYWVECENRTTNHCRPVRRQSRHLTELRLTYDNRRRPSCPNYISDKVNYQRNKNLFPSFNLFRSFKLTPPPPPPPTANLRFAVSEATPTACNLVK